ncbi:hypothetical protein GCK72_001129 [Caenorhabditis remanei]|uniref:RING-type domain-containing protein n=1 Tax=Caenorhabditis remanei TaxID=31234 RepID=A0A6A5HU53_CAERE|nr:hypothetical protein GCK72_001129 [Caenorhabditis remanei]KAF1769312.1 hypothetical protein GCK72_001129 [Caenorhabditis remanei]
MLNFKSSMSVQPFIRTPTCQVCLEPYDGKRHTPKILQCAHTVCESCINVLEEQSRRRYNTGLDPTIVSISCPVCRTETKTPRACIRTNYQLIDVVDGMCKEATHNIAFVNCIECEGVYHEKDVNICTQCSPINEDTNTNELVERSVSLHQFSLCSTCLLAHIGKKHSFIPLQPLRVEMQRQENIRRILQSQEKLTKSQLRFRELLDKTMAKWILWSGNHELNMTRFREATESYHQKTLFEKFMEEISTKTEQIDNLITHVQMWSDELERDMPRSEFLARFISPDRTPEGARLPNAPPVPPRPAAQPPLPGTPRQHNAGNEENFLYYFERQ